MKKEQIYEYEESMKKNDLLLNDVTMSNELARAKSKMNKGELKLFYIIVSQLNPFQTNGNVIKILKQDVWDILDLNADGKYTKTVRRLRNIISETIVDFIDEKGELFVGAMLQKVKTKGKFYEFTIAEELMPELEKIDQKQYTNFLLKNTLVLKSTYSIKLYQMLMSWRDKGTWAVYEKTLRQYFNCEDKYLRKDNFERRTIISSVEEINEKTNLQVEWHPVKKGNFTIGWAFDFKEIQTKNAQKGQIEWERVRDEDVEEFEQARLPF